MSGSSEMPSSMTVYNIHERRFILIFGHLWFREMEPAKGHYQLERISFEMNIDTQYVPQRQSYPRTNFSMWRIVHGMLKRSIPLNWVLWARCDTLNAIKNGNQINEFIDCKWYLLTIIFILFICSFRASHSIAYSIFIWFSHRIFTTAYKSFNRIYAVDNWFSWVSL